ncbi:hypothetical protein HYH02_001254 [Chlamydomonas schloesseri]|uniref:protein-tyrosine-phosphatase n=1 Tax=Chlamydomonas schloesseri TaxID=2026947 RepID=A0A836BD01_9CHLO|nr:hypothetical protein HYH02_001254 [Chlamydomonas schloesseri]|eukprot:KAG2454220.1 hypothetical protein HYH02_001254 [Chlamydomonas schloesseri]
MAGGWPTGPVQVNSEHAGAMKSSPERGTHVHGSSAFLQALGDSAMHAEPASRPPEAGGPAAPGAVSAVSHAAYAAHHVAPSCPDLAGAPQVLQYHNPQHSASTPMLHPGHHHPHQAPPAPYTLAYTQYEQHHHGDQLYQYQAQGGMTQYAWQGYHAHGSDFMAKGGSGDGGGRSMGTSSNGSGIVSAATGNTPTVGAGAWAPGAGVGSAAAGTPFSAGRPPLPPHSSIAEAAGGSAARPSPAPDPGAGGPGPAARQQPAVGGVSGTGDGAGVDTEMYDPLAHAMDEDEVTAAPVAAGGARPAPVAVQSPPATAVAATGARHEQQQQQQLQPPEVDLIVVWDLDETLIVFNSLISGAFARAAALAASRSARTAAAAASAAGRGSPGRGAGGHSLAAAAEAAVLPRQAEALGQRLADLVFEFCDEHMGFKSLDQLDPLSFTELWALAAASEAGAQAVADAAAEDAAAASGDVAAAAASAAAAAAAAAVAAAGPVSRATLERIAAAYGSGAAGLPALLGAEKAGVLAAALAEVEALTGGWVAAARRLLTGLNTAVEQQAARRAAATAAGEDEAAAAGPWLGITAPPPALSYRRVRHVLVSAGHLVATLGKLLMWGLDEHFDIRDVYSASGRSKLDAFRQLRATLGAHNAFAAVGDGAEEERAAGVMGWGFVRVGLTPSSSSSSAPHQQHQQHHAHHHSRAATDGNGRGDGAAAIGSMAGAAGAGAGAAGAAGGSSSQFGYRSVSPLARSESTSPPQPWQLPRPLADIAAQEVLCAAREAYWYF